MNFYVRDLVCGFWMGGVKEYHVPTQILRSGCNFIPRASFQKFQSSNGLMEFSPEKF